MKPTSNETISQLNLTDLTKTNPPLNQDIKLYKYFKSKKDKRNNNMTLAEIKCSEKKPWNLIEIIKNEYHFSSDGVNYFIKKPPSKKYFWEKIID